MSGKRKPKAGKGEGGARSARGRRAQPGRTPAWVPRFLAVFKLKGNVTEAAEAAEVDRAMPYRRRETDPKFAEAWRQAEESAADRLELEMWRRGHDGVPRKKFHKGEPIMDPATGQQYVENEYSDQLILALIRARRAEYRERHQHEHTGPGGGPVQIAVVEVVRPDVNGSAPAS